MKNPRAFSAIPTLVFSEYSALGLFGVGHAFYLLTPTH